LRRSPRWRPMSMRTRWCVLTVRPGGRADLRQFDGDAGLGAPQGAGSGAGAVAARAQYSGDAGGERGPRPGARACRCGGGRVAGGRAGRLLRTAHDGHPRFPGAIGWCIRQHGHSGPAQRAGSRSIRRSAGSGSRSFHPRDPRATPRRPAQGPAASELPRCRGRKASGKPRCMCSLAEVKAKAGARRPAKSASIRLIETSGRRLGLAGIEVGWARTVGRPRCTCTPTATHAESGSPGCRT
jgi:hypothetical protein